jgi:hypothetical protein
MTMTDPTLRATIYLGGRPLPAVVRALTLAEIELEIGEVEIAARRATVELEVPGDAGGGEGEGGPLRVGGEVVRSSPGSVALRILGFSPGGRARVERWLDERDTLSLAVVDDEPLLLAWPVARIRTREVVGPEYTRPLPQVVTSIPPGARRVATPVGRK